MSNRLRDKLLCDHAARCAGAPGALRSINALVVLFAVSFAGLTGCGTMKDWVHNGFKVGPEYYRPAAPVSDAWMETYNEKVATELPDNPMWWEVFNDPVLNQLVQGVYEENLSLRSAGMRVLVARAQRGVMVGGLFPQLQENFGSYQRAQISTTTAGLGQLIGKGLPIKRDFSTWSTGFDAYWELDVWGKFRRGIESADANLDASIEDYDAILVSLLAETASTYVEYRTYQQQLAYATSNVEIQKGSLGIAQAQFDGGRVSELDVTQAQANLKNTEQLVPLFEAQVRAANNRLCTLLGLPTQDLSTELGDSKIPVAPPEVAVGVPADLLRRRPDIRAAERRVAAQSALIGVAIADLYPHFSITGNMRVDSERFKDLFSQASSAGLIGPGFNWDILNYGRLVNNIRIQDALFQQLAYDYQQTVLTANQESETAIYAFLKSQERLIDTRDAVAASQRSVEIVTLQYREGATDFNRVFNLQTLLVQDQDRYAQTQGDVSRALIAIYKSLGGGWEIRNGYVPMVTDVAAPAESTPAMAVPEEAPQPADVEGAAS